MFRKIPFIGLILASLFIWGCATTRPQHMEIQRLHTQLQDREKELKLAEKEIEDLEWQLEKERQMRRAMEKRLVQKSKQVETTPSVSIKKIQLALQKAGFYHGAIDGKLGSRTKEAIRAFQKSKGLKVDGIVGKATWRELARYLSE